MLESSFSLPVPVQNSAEYAAFMRLDASDTSAALSLTVDNRWTKTLSEQRIEQLRPLLTEEQLNKLTE